MGDRWKKIKNLSLSEVLMMMEALVNLAFWSTLTLALPVRFYNRYLGLPGRVSPFEPEQGREIEVRQVGLAVRRMSRFTPWKNRCLGEAITAKKMLGRRKIQSTLYLGVAKKEGKLIAHAWCRQGAEILTGKKGHSRFKIVTTFV